MNTGKGEVHFSEEVDINSGDGYDTEMAIYFAPTGIYSGGTPSITAYDEPSYLVNVGITAKTTNGKVYTSSEPVGIKINHQICSHDNYDNVCYSCSTEKINLAPNVSSVGTVTNGTYKDGLYHIITCSDGFVGLEKHTDNGSGICSTCGGEICKHTNVTYTSAGEYSHLKKCNDCGFETYEIHTFDMGGDSTDTGSLAGDVCSLCGYQQ